jgi:hypothetical protein
MATLNTVTSSTRPASPAAGEAYFETDTNKIIVWTGSEWTEIVSDTVPSFVNTYSVDFDGTNDYISIPHSSSLTISGDMTISAWVYRDSTDAGYLPILTKRPSSATSTTYQFYLDRITDGGRLRFYEGSAVNSPSGGTSIPTNQWVHVAISVDSGVTNGTKWYVNGTAESSTNTFSITKSNTEEARIGRLGPTSYYAKGKIDEVALFNSALSASDITAIYNSGVPDDLTSYSPVSWWRMGDDDSGTGTTITDQGSGSNDGTLTNGPTFSSDVPS